MLIVKLSSLGDVVHTMPAVQDVLRHVPAVQVDWVVEQAFSPLVQRCKGVSRVIPFGLRRWRKAPLSLDTLRAWNAFRADLRRSSYGAVIDLQGLTKSAWVSWMARLTEQGQRFALGHRTEGSSYEAPTRWVADVAVSMPLHVHAVERARRVCAAAMGYALHEVMTVAPDYGLVPQRMALPDKAGIATSSLPTEPKTVLLIHGASRAAKQWPLAHWHDLARRLGRAGYAVALVHGCDAEERSAHAIAEAGAHVRVWPRMALDALVDAMANCAGVIGGDTGLSHIAVALDLPHVQLYNTDTFWRTGPPVREEGVDGQEGCAVRQCSVVGQPTVDVVWAAWQSVSGIVAS
ncbi:lipopolysaccharide heptosyltransferase I [Candidatus Symbiobacter mobilis]|uniref:lipopolysaccharide heptosyltransferase I n=1 Tax=Candidatus Symbiobacter mobilis TaxID=1436290 RepID=UPI001EE68B87|nr:lipopolysaccharide heptosyltransferase I [Candidatus Symbiobacter mobilis]